MPLDLAPGLPVAFADLGDGGAHDPQIRFTAPDSSCLWEGFPVELVADALPAFTPTDPSPTSQILDWSTAATAGVQTPGESVWPGLRAYDYLESVLAGYKLHGRMRFTVSSGRGSFGISNPYSGAGYGFFDTGVAVVDIDTGDVDLGGPDCSQAAAATDGMVTFGLAWFNFNPLVGDGIIHGRFEASWVFDAGPLADYAPFQPYRVDYQPPGSAVPGLRIHLPTTSCGALTKTYNNLKTTLDAMNVAGTCDIVASINHNGTDVAAPDAGALAGADCSGFIRNRTAAPS